MINIKEACALAEWPKSLCVIARLGIASWPVVAALFFRWCVSEGVSAAA